MNEQPYKWMKFSDNEVFLDVRVIPNSSKNSISHEEEFLKVKLTAPAVDNKANKALVEYLSKLLKMPKTSIEIISGHTSKNKRLKFRNSSKILLKNIFLC